VVGGRTKEGKTEIVFAHRPLLNYQDQFNPFGDAEQLVSLLDPYDVVMYMNGHEHESAEVTRNGTYYIWCDNLSYFHTGIETYNLFKVFPDQIRLYHVSYDGSQELAHVCTLCL